jgi:hypothetical protein
MMDYQMSLEWDRKPPRTIDRDSQKMRVLRMLRSNEWVTNTDFCRAFLPNFRSRLSELRREGYEITEGEYVRKGVWKYRLMRSPL